MPTHPIFQALLLIITRLYSKPILHSNSATCMFFLKPESRKAAKLVQAALRWSCTWQYIVLWPPSLLLMIWNI